MLDRILRSNGVVVLDVDSVVGLVRCRELIVDRTEEDTVVLVKERGVLEDSG